MAAPPREDRSRAGHAGFHRQGLGDRHVLRLRHPLRFSAHPINPHGGTFVTNHFSIFIIYPVQCWLGNRLLGGDLSYGAISHALRDLVKEQSWDALARIGGELVAAFFVGGLLFAAVFTPLTYLGVRALVRRHRARKAARAETEVQDG